MMKTYQIKLTPMSPFQLFPPSDTLFGAICWGIKRIYSESKLTEILQGFQDSPKFILSSSFPYIESNGNNIAFYPKPITAGLSPSDIDEIAKTKNEKVDVITRYKKFKKAEYVSQPIFKRFLKGDTEKMLFQEYLNGNLKIEWKMLIGKEEYGTAKPSVKSGLIQKNSIDRLAMSTGEEGETFYQQEYFTNPEFKLHFLMKTGDINFFKPVFRYFEDKGIGGNRSTGKGRFKIEVQNQISIGDNNFLGFITLSRYIPDISEIILNGDSMFYEIFPYRSKIDSEAEFKGDDIWKVRVMYIKEGSFFKAKEKKESYGMVSIVKEIEGQKIYQNGLAFPVFGDFGGSR